MKVNITVKDNSAKFLALVRRGVAAGLARAATIGAEVTRQSFGKGERFKGSTPGTPPNIQRGALRNSIRSGVVGDTKAWFGSSLVYARIQETGGTITAKGKALPVPMNMAAKRLLEKTAPTQAAIGFMGPPPQGGLRVSGAAYGLVPIKSKGRTFLVAAKKLKGRFRTVARGTKGQTHNTLIKINEFPAFVLKRSIRLPARPYLVPAMIRANPAMVRGFVARAGAIIRGGSVAIATGAA